MSLEFISSILLLKASLKNHLLKTRRGSDRSDFSNPNGLDTANEHDYRGVRTTSMTSCEREWPCFSFLAISSISGRILAVMFTQKYTFLYVSIYENCD